MSRHVEHRLRRGKAPDGPGEAVDVEKSKRSEEHEGYGQTGYGPPLAWEVFLASPCAAAEGELTVMLAWIWVGMTLEYGSHTEAGVIPARRAAW